MSQSFGPPSRIEDDIFVWACLSVNGPRVARLVQDKFDTKTYISLLKRDILPHVTPHSLFMQDHFPVHFAAAVKTWMKENDFNVFPSWPEKSGDLMPLNSLFSKLVANINQHKLQPIRSKEKLWAEVDRHFSLLCQDDEYITGLFDSMPGKMKNIILNEGNLL